VSITDQDLEGLVSVVATSTKAYMHGEMRRYHDLIRHADDFTLMPPYGGGPVRDMDVSEEALDARSRYFRGGEAELEVCETHASGDLAVIVAIERQRGLVGDFPEQDWSLRITLVFRRVGSEWQLVHRHADPLVREIGMERMAALARE
jgi:ketosteroid isomerase-like protein